MSYQLRYRSGARHGRARPNSLSWIAVAAGLACLTTGAARAQDSDANASTLQKVQVTGSSIKRIEGETALPVQILNRADIQRSGVTTVEQLLRSVSATSSLGGTQVANTGAGGGQGGGSSTSLVSLRGLGSARTLVLVNGRRVAPAAGTSAVDIASIPLNMIERVEVLKDGASAVYGSDAIAGVVNFILRKEVDGVEVSGTLGAPTRSGGGFESKMSAIGGYGNYDTDHYSLTWGASAQTIKPIFGSDRSFARNINVANQLDKTSTTAFPANIRLPNGQLASPAYPNCGPTSIVSPLSPGLCRYDNAPFDAIQPDSRLTTLSLNGRANISSAVEGYFEGSLSRNKTTNITQHVLINGAALPAGSPYIASLTNLLNTQYPQFPALRSLIGSAWALLPPTSPYYPTAFAAANGIAGQPLPLLFRSTPTGLRKTEDIENASRLVTGIRGNVASWDYDTALLYSKNRIQTNLTQGWALTNDYLNLLNTGVINPFGPTTDQNALNQAMADTYNGIWNVTTQSILSWDGKASREIFKLPAGGVNVAFGAEFRRESLAIAPSAANQQFLVSGFGAPGVPVNANRNIASAFSELTVPIFKTLEADAAVRYDHYQNVGKTINPKGSLRWQPIEQILVRGSYGSGFRAPTLVDLYQPAARGISTNGQRDLLRCPIGTTGLIDCSTQFVTLGGGNPSLQPEKSKSRTFGVLIEPTKEYSIGVDYFQTNIAGVIRTGLSVAQILGNPSQFANFIHRGAPDGNPSGLGPILGIDQGQINLGQTVVAGYDLDVKARVLNLPAHKVTTRLNGTYLTRYDQQNTDGSFTSSINNPGAVGIGVAIRWRHTASVTWDTGDWSSTLMQNYQAGYHDLRTSLQPSSVVPRHVGSYQTWDAQVSYTGIPKTRITLGIKNLADRNPPYTNYGAGFVGSYDLSYTDVRGRFAYLAAAYTFK